LGKDHAAPIASRSADVLIADRLSAIHFPASRAVAARCLKYGHCAAILARESQNKILIKFFYSITFL
jgi:hypothetical protein